MKNIKNLSILALLLGIFFTSCQTESVLEQHSIKETISKTTPLTTYIQRVAMEKTSQDNVVDDSSCFLIKFPYTITINAIPIVINSTSDYQLVVNAINANSTDDDIIYIAFPITIIYENYTEKIINNQTDYNKAISDCKNNKDDFGKINCLNIIYPITLNIYNSNEQIANAIQITDNKYFFDFIKTLDPNQYIAISYPIQITDLNGQNVIIANNNELEDAIKNAIDNCVIIANPNPNPNPIPLDFIQVLTSNTWKVSYYFNDKEKTYIYKGYSFVFNANNTVIATKDGVAKNGTWFTKVSNGKREFQIKIATDLLKELDESWKVLEFNATQLRFRDPSDGINETDYLYFEKI